MHQKCKGSGLALGSVELILDMRFYATEFGRCVSVEKLEGLERCGRAKWQGKT